MLSGIKVIDFSQYLPAPHTTLRLAELGAEVIKVESPAGDPSRAPSGDEEMGYIFQAQNRNKKSIVLNLKDEADKELALQLIATADVVVESYRPGVADRLGIGYKEALSVNEKVIYCSLSGYGSTETMRHLGGHDLNYLSISGVLSQLKDQTGRPIQPGTQLADFIGGITASEAILGALVKRERTGEPSYLDISITDSLFPFMSNHFLIEGYTGEQNGADKLGGKYVCYYIYETKDGRYVTLGALEPKFWKNLCHALNKESWLTGHFSKTTDDNPVFKELKEVFANRTLDEWTKFSMEVDCCLAPILETSEVVNHPLVKSRNLVFTKQGVNYTATRFSEQESKFSPPPKLSQHADELKQLK